MRSKRISVEEINIGDERFQFRFRKNSDDLIQSIKDAGQLHPVTLWRRSTKGLYLVVDGFRRIDACLKLGIPEVDAHVVSCTEDQAYARAYLENAMRKSLTPLEKATGICSVIERIGKDDAARQLGISTKQLNRYVELLDTPPSTKRALAKGTISMAHALIINEYLPSVDHSEGELLKLAEINSAAELRKVLKKRRKRGRRRRYTRIEKDVLRVYPFSFNILNSTAQDRKVAVKALRDAIQFIESAR